MGLAQNLFRTVETKHTNALSTWPLHEVVLVSATMPHEVLEMTHKSGHLVICMNRRKETAHPSAPTAYSCPFSHLGHMRQIPTHLWMSSADLRSQNLVFDTNPEVHEQSIQSPEAKRSQAWTSMALPHLFPLAEVVDFSPFGLLQWYAQHSLQ